MASHSSSSGSRSNSVPTSSRSSPSGQTSSSASSLNRSGSIDHQTLLTPVVRSKRTPIACTECRRRQVKCTGTTPKCERCEKKGVKCEYIPCSQQKASTTASPSSSPAQLGSVYNGATTKGSQSSQYVSSQWQSSSRHHQMYMAESSMPYQQHPDWQANTSASMLQQSQFYGNASYSPPSYPSSNSSAISATGRPGATYAQPGVVPSQAYLGSGYSQVLGVQTLSYPYDVAGSDHPHVLVGQSSNYPEYYQSQGDAFDTRATGLVSEHSEKAWTDSVGSTYSSFQGHYV